MLGAPLLAWWARRAGIPEFFILIGLSASLTAVVAVLEHFLPYRSDWGARGDNLAADAVHGLVSSTVPTVVIESLFKASIVQAAVWIKSGVDLWPDEWPMAAQVCLALLVADFGFYAVHRHLHKGLWRWHAPHHSMERMYFLAGARMHPGEVLFTTPASMGLLWLVGAPNQVILYKMAAHIVIGTLAHCNVDLRLGWLNGLFMGPDLHRVHHSAVVEESSHNFGNNLIVWDALFGTRHLPAEPPARLGIDMPFSNTFVGHMLLPFPSMRKNRKCEAIADGNVVLR